MAHPFHKRKKAVVRLEELKINITSLMDVLTVLLFFLILFFSANSLNFYLPNDLSLPTAKLKDPATEALIVSISKWEIRVQDLVVANLQDGSFKKTDLASDQRTIIKLEKVFREQLEKRNKAMLDPEAVAGVAAAKQTLATSLPPGKIIFEIDKDLTFSTIKHLLYTASKSGYGDYQFLHLNN